MEREEAAMRPPERANASMKAQTMVMHHQSALQAAPLKEGSSGSFIWWKS
jgi:hypothetical protein